MKTKEESIDTGSDPWNIAKGYVTLKILKLLVECDIYVKVSLYGVEDIENELILTPQQKMQLRINSLDRLYNTLKALIENSIFAITKKELPKILKYKLRLDNISKKFRDVSKLTIDQQTKIETLEVDEPSFQFVLQELRAIKEEINTELNDANLIFPSSEEYDLSKMKDELIHGG